MSHLLFELIQMTRTHLSDVFFAFAIAGLLILIALSLRYVLLRFVEYHADSQKAPLWKSVLRDALKSISPTLLIIISLLLAAMTLTLPDRVISLSRGALEIAIVFQVALVGDQFLVFLIRHSPIMKREKGLWSRGTVPMLIVVLRVAFWTIVSLFLLDNLGYDIAALVAGLGVGGIAIALASRNILGDLFASFSILFDRPFSIGDFIVVGDCLGKVESIGLKTTRIRSLSGEQLIFSNNDLLVSRIRNFKRMKERRVVFNIDVVYETSVEVVEKIPLLLKQIVDDEPEATFNRAHLKDYGASALVYEVVYYVQGSDYNHYMDVQQKLNFKVYELFHKEGIEFAYPTSTVYLQQPTRGEKSHG